VYFFIMSKTIFVLLGLLALSQALPRRLKLWPTRIVGGSVVERNELPYQISLQYYGSHICGGTVLNENYIVTAGHCAEVGSASTFSIVAGDHSLQNVDGTEQTRAVSRVIIHEEYDSWTIENDIALLKLTTPLTLNAAVQSLPLAPEGHDATGNGIVSGWGTLTSGGSLPDLLHKVAVPIVSDKECEEAYGSGEIAASMICAGLDEGGKDSCQGDSGGPLVCSDVGASYLCGIVSWGYGCAVAGYPGVYTEVAYFSQWVAINSAA